LVGLGFADGVALGLAEPSTTYRADAAWTPSDALTET
jgi:hypothetical protein